jgi:MFS family permease
MSWLRRLQERCGAACAALLPEGDLLREATYRRLWSSILISSLGGQVTLLALPLTAAVLLHASPTQMGVLTFVEILPFVLFSLPSGVWLDRVRKLPVYVIGETALAAVVATVPLAWALGWLAMSWMYVVAFVIGTVYTTAGTAAQIVLTQVVTRDRLVEAHAKNALASSGAEVAGPGLAGALIKLVGAPLALLVDAVLLLISAAILRGIRVREVRHARPDAAFLGDLKAGVRFVRGHRLLVALAATVGGWQMFNNAATVVQILFATRTLGLSAQSVGLAYVGLGVGTVLASSFGHRLSRRIGPGLCLVLGIAVCGAGWLVVSMVPANAWGVFAFAAMLFCFGVGAVLIFINFLALRQAVTPEPLLGRMTSTMRWLILLPAGPGALIGGWLGEHVGLRAALAFAGGGALLLALAAARHPVIRGVRELPKPEAEEDLLGAEATVRPSMEPG